MTKKLFLISLLLLGFEAESQISFNFSSYDAYSLDDRAVPLDLIDQNDEGFIFLFGGGRFGYKGKTLRKFDKNLQPNGQKTNLISEENPNNARTVGIVSIKNELVHISYEDTPESRKFYRQLIYKENMQLGEKRFISEIIDDEKSYKNAFSYFLNYDSSKFALIHSVPNKKKDFQKLKNIQFDSEFNETGVEEYEFEYLNKQLEFQYLTFLSKDSILVVGKHFNDFYQTGILTKDYEYKIFILTNGLVNEVAGFSQNLEHIRGIQFKLLGNKLISTGFYSSKNIYAAKGIYFNRIDLKTGIIEIDTTQDFDQTFLIKTVSPNQVKGILRKFEKGTYEAPYFLLNEVIINNDSTFTLLGEQLYTVTTYGATTFFYLDLAAIKVDYNGSIVWNTRIARNSERANVGYYSDHFITKRGDDLVLYLNDSEANLKYISGKPSKTFKNSDIMLSAMVIKPSGAFTRNKIASQSEMSPILIRPGLTIPTKENSLVFFGQIPSNVKNQRFFKVDIE